MADKYALTGNWSAAGTWSLTDGGAGGAGAPSASENAYFSNNSGNVVVDATATCFDLDFTKGTGYAGTFSGSAALTVSGNIFKLRAGMTRTYTGAITFNASSGTVVITTAGITLQSNWILNAVGATAVQAADNMTQTGGVVFFYQAGGAFDANGKKVTFTGNAVPRIRADGGTLTFFDLERSGVTGATSELRLSHGITVAGTFTVTGQSANVNRILVSSYTAGGVADPGVQKTITAANVALTNCDFSDIVGAGAATWSGTSIGNAGGNSGITFTTPVTRHWVATSGGSWSSTASWSATAGGASGATVPLCHDTVIGNAGSITSSGRTITVDVPRWGANVDFSALLNSPILSFSVANSVFGSLSLATGMTTSGSATTFAARGAATITTNGVAYVPAITFNGPGATFTLGSALTCSAAITRTNGALNDGGFSVTCTTFTATGSDALTKGAGTWTLTGTGTVWSVASTVAVTDTGTVKITDSSSSSKTFAGGGKTYGTLWLSGTGTGTFDNTGANTFTEYRIDANLSVRFTAAVNTTAATWTIGNNVTIGSITAAGHTLTKSGGGHVSVYGCTISRSTASPANTFYAAGSTDGGNNVSWTFAGFPYTLSGAAGSFTEAGQAAGLLYGRRLAADAGSFSLAGQAAGIVNLISNPRYVVRRRASNFTIRA